MTLPANVEEIRQRALRFWPGSETEAPRQAVEDICDLCIEIERLNSWSGLMSILDEHYPVDIFVGDKDTADPGVRIVGLIRWIDHFRGVLKVREGNEDHLRSELAKKDAEIADLRESREAWALSAEDAYALLAAEAKT